MSPSGVVLEQNPPPPRPLPSFPSRLQPLLPLPKGPSLSSMHPCPSLLQPLLQLRYRTTGAIGCQHGLPGMALPHAYALFLWPGLNKTTLCKVRFCFPGEQALTDNNGKHRAEVGYNHRQVSSSKVYSN